MFPGIQLLPGVWLAKLFGFGAGGITLGWRLWAGVTLSLGFYLICRLCLRGAWMAAGATVVMLLDHGIIQGRVLDRHFFVWATLLRDGTDSTWFGSSPLLLHQWRVITPSLSLVSLWLHVVFLIRAIRNPTKMSIAAAGVAFGILFWAYFYYWTAATMALVLTWMFRPESRRVCFHSGWIGGLLGLPSVLAASAVKHDFGVDWLQRANKFVPVDRWSEFILPPVAVGLVGLGLTWCWWRRRDLFPLAALAISGFILSNQSAASGMQLEDNHWNYVWMPCSCLLLGLLTASEIEARSPYSAAVRGTFIAGLLLHASVGMAFRVLETTRSLQTIGLNQGWQRYQAQRDSRTHNLFKPREVIAGDEVFGSCAVIQDNLRTLFGGSQIFSPQVRDQEMAQRRALNAWLQGRNRDQFERKLRQLGEITDEEPQGPESRSFRPRAAVKAMDEIGSDPDRWVRVFEVRFVALPTGTTPPVLTKHRWARIESGPTWDVWLLE